METGELTRFDYGGSCPVENVQALASKKLKEIPPSNLKPEAENDEASVDDSLIIPVIDMSKLLDQQYPLTHHDDELERLHLACKEWGFFQLINHGVPEEVMEKMKTDIEEFFKLPLEKKKAHAKLSNDIEGFGQFVLCEEEKEPDWGDMLFLIPHPISLRDIRFWPTHPTSFRESIEKYSWELRKVTICLLKFMSRNLGIDSETLTSMFEDGTQSLRLNCYRPCVHAKKVPYPHSDASGLSLLIQVNDVQGLQIKKNGKWVPVKPVPSALIINIGDMIEIMSNGEYRSIEHNVVVNSEKLRLSIASFHMPRGTTLVAPLPDLLKENRAKYRSILCGDYLRQVHETSKLDGKSMIDHLKLEQ